MGSSNGIGGFQKPQMTQPSTRSQQQGTVAGNATKNYHGHRCATYSPVYQYVPHYSLVSTTTINHIPLGDRSLSVLPPSGVIRLMPGQSVVFADGANVHNYSNQVADVKQNSVYQFTGYSYQPVSNSFDQYQRDGQGSGHQQNVSQQNTLHPQTQQSVSTDQKNEKTNSTTIPKSLKLQEAADQNASKLEMEAEVASELSDLVTPEEIAAQQKLMAQYETKDGNQEKPRASSASLHANKQAAVNSNDKTTEVKHPFERWAKGEFDHQTVEADQKLLTYLIQNQIPLDQLTEDQWTQVEWMISDLWQKGGLDSNQYSSDLSQLKEIYSGVTIKQLCQKLQGKSIWNEAETKAKQKQGTASEQVTPKLNTAVTQNEKSGKNQSISIPPPLPPPPPPLPSKNNSSTSTVKAARGIGNSTQSLPELSQEELMFIEQLNVEIRSRNTKSADNPVEQWHDLAEIKVSENSSEIGLFASFVRSLDQGYTNFKKTEPFNKNPEQSQALYQGIRKKFTIGKNFKLSDAVKTSRHQTNPAITERYQRFLGGVQLQSAKYGDLQKQQLHLSQLSHTLISAQNTEGRLLNSQFTEVLDKTTLSTIMSDYFVQNRSNAVEVSEKKALAFEQNISAKISAFQKQYGHDVNLRQLWSTLNNQEKMQFREYAQQRLSEIQRAMNYAKDERQALNIQNWPVHK